MARKKYTYIMRVTELVKSTCTIESERMLSYEQLRKKAERLRSAGMCEGHDVTATDVFCENAACDGTWFEAFTDELIKGS